jgi:hypothetical protein
MAVRRWARVAVWVAVLCAWGHASAQPKLDARLDDPELSVLANTVWAMVLPERDFAGGCVVGFLAFKFQPTGYFIYNNRVSGWWRLDTVTGNIRMRTREGHRFMLAMDGDSLRVPQNTPFLKRGNVFQKCGPSE